MKKLWKIKKMIGILKDLFKLRLQLLIVLLIHSMSLNGIQYFLLEKKIETMNQKKSLIMFMIGE
jgi:hypothetical protein